MFANSCWEGGWSILGIDFDPQALRLAAAQVLPVQYGDSEDPEFTASLPLSSATVDAMV